MIVEPLRRDDKRALKQTKLRQALAGKLVEARETPGKGRGLFALADFAVREVVCGIDGKRVLLEEVPEAAMLYALKDQQKPGYAIVPDLEAVGWHVANHSCQPNACLGTDSIPQAIFAERPIRRGDEITVTYGWQVNPPTVDKCMCGAANCYGRIGVAASSEGLYGHELAAYLTAMVANRNRIGVLCAFDFVYSQQGERVDANCHGWHRSSGEGKWLAR